MYTLRAVCLLLHHFVPKRQRARLVHVRSDVQPAAVELSVLVVEAAYRPQQYVTNWAPTTHPPPMAMHGALCSSSAATASEKCSIGR
jgi:hypothetical protein